MKKIILMATLFCAALSNAQNIEYTTNGGATISDEQVFTFNTLTENTAKMLIHLKNNGSETFRFKIRVDDVTGNPETGFNMDLQFCFTGTCYFSVIEGNYYPGNPVVLAPGASNDPTDHFWNSYAGVDSQPVSYSFTVVEVDADENPIQDLISFTYNYSPTASVNDFDTLQNMGISLNSTVANSHIGLTAQTAATMDLYDTAGKKVKTARISQGSQAIDVSGISNGIYFANFILDDNRTGSISIIKN